MSHTVSGYGPKLAKRKEKETWKPEPGTYWVKRSTGRVYVVESITVTGTKYFKEYVYVHRINSRYYRHRCSLEHFRSEYRLAHPSEVAIYQKAPF